MANIKVGDKLIVDGFIRAVIEVNDPQGVAVSDAGKMTYFDTREVLEMADGFFGMPGRIEPHKAVKATVVAQPAVAMAQSE